MRWFQKKELVLVIALPLISVAMGITAIVVAFSGADQEIPREAPALNKTSWREEG